MNVHNIYFPNTIWMNIFSFDPTYKLLYNNVMDEIRLRFDNGKWWIKRTGLLVKEPPETKNNLFINQKTRHRYKRHGLVELNFLTRDTDLYLSKIFFKHRDIIQELHNKTNKIN